MAQTVRMVKTLDLTDAPGAGRQRWQFRLPFPRIRGNLDDSSVHDMGVHYTTAAAIVAASAGDDVFARTRPQTGLFVKGALHFSERLPHCCKQWPDPTLADNTRAEASHTRRRRLLVSKGLGFPTKGRTERSNWQQH